MLVHLLKWQYQPSRRSKSWRVSLVEHRNRIPRLMLRAPSLSREMEVMVKEEYAGACRKASAQTGLSVETFPLNCPWTLYQICDLDFLPD